MRPAALPIPEPEVDETIRNSYPGRVRDAVVGSLKARGKACEFV